MSELPKARIENWYVVAGHLIGEIHDHPRQDQFRARVQITSRIVSADFSAGWARTENTLYLLGKRNEDVRV